MSLVVKGEARRHQLVTTYGVGAIVALGDESFMVAGLDYWEVEDPNIHEPRLERELNVHGFVDPPASGDQAGRDIPIVRFPEMHSCPECKRLAPHRVFTTYDGNKCGLCEELLIPSRFIVACRNGHIDDFPYFRWVHAHSPPTGDEHELRLQTVGATASLRDVVISCTCGKEMSLDGAFRAQALRGISECSGRSPWLRSVAPGCPEVPRTLQRGASNVWSPVLHSALSIPPWSEGAFQAINKYWGILRHVPDDALAETLDGLAAVKRSGFSTEDLVAAVVRRKRELSGEENGIGELGIRSEEFEALARGRAESASTQDFVCQTVPIDGTPLATWFARVMAVTRLREVRALQSFTRVDDPGPSDSPERRAPLFETNPGWLPAIEVSGEGVFIELDAARLARWEHDPGVAARIKSINARYRKRFADVGKEPDREISARLVLLHTLAHLLISQWSLECGYPAAALRERIYAGASMAGLLIYTATTDSAGSLGGVVALSEPVRLLRAVAEMAERAAWCSSDPLCSESTAAGVDSLNLAACHACALLPEVSCEEMNVLLDRATAVDTPGAPPIGFLDQRYD